MLFSLFYFKSNENGDVFMFNYNYVIFSHDQHTSPTLNEQQQKHRRQLKAGNSHVNICVDAFIIAFLYKYS